MNDTDDLLGAVFERPAEEWQGALAELCEQHPAHADELRRRFELLRRAGLAEPESETKASREFPERFGSYRLERRLGGGGMGVVYQARHVDLDRPVALKLVRPERLWFENARARFAREIEAVARLDHQGCVQIHQVGESDGVPFFAMELIAGLSLQQIIERLRSRAVEALGGEDLAVELRQATGQPTTDVELFRGAWTRVCMRILRAAADALGHAHEKGVIHRDVKPSNLMVTPGGRVVVIDFGLAVAEGTDRMTSSGAMLGSLPYMAPEQIEGQRGPIDARTDVYALGVCLYELLTLTSPFESASSDVTRARILAGTAAPLRELNPTVDTDLAVICARAMEIEPVRRYQSAAEFASDLVAALEHRAIRARPISVGLRLVRWIRREPWQATALMFLLIGLVATSIGFALAARRATENARLADEERHTRERLADTLRDFDLLSGVSALERAIAAERDAFPAWPSRLGALRDWQREHFAQLDALRPRLQQGLAALGSRTRERTADEREADRRAHPKFPALRAAERELAWTLAVAARFSTPTPPADLSPREQALPAVRLHTLAWQRVAPLGEQRERDDQAPLGLAYALAAVRAKGAKPDHDFLDTLAWAWFANGHGVEAKATATRAVEAAPPESAREFTERRDSLHKAVDDPRARIATLERSIRELEAEIERGARPRLIEPAQQFLFDTLRELDAKLARVLPDLAQRVAQRIAWAERIGELSRAHPEAGATWESARRAIATADDVVASVLYRDIDIPLSDDAVVGLVPIGMNPQTKLWEFYDLHSAWDGKSDPATLPIPRHAADGSIRMGDATGVVFVLLPGGDCLIGSQADEAEGPNYHPRAPGFWGPVQIVTLWPFLIARHELTIAQWSRLVTGPDDDRFPSGHPSGSTPREGERVGLTNPVERISWHTAARVLAEQGWSLPTESQWEYACRGGTSTPWSCGKESSSLESYANVNDACAVRGAAIPEPHEAFDDHFKLHAPVGSFRANPFGLYDMHGNVAEWCLDPPATNMQGFRDGNGERPNTPRPGDRSMRGGSYMRPGAACRSSFWTFMPAESRLVDVGVRPVRRLR